MPDKSLPSRSAICFTNHTLAAFALVVSAGFSQAFASGSMSPSEGRGADVYTTGKSVYFKQIACDNCAYAGRGRDAADAKALLITLKSADSKVKLDSLDYEAVKTYLSKRFRISEMQAK